MKRSDLTELLGYEPGREQRLIILKEVKETGLSIQEVADKFAMPPLFIRDDDGKILYKGEKMTSEQFNKKFPHRRFVTIARRKNNDE
jgi:hypothetical protein